MTLLGTSLEAPRRLLQLPAPLCPFISVVVPVRNEEPFLRQTLDQLLAQDYDPERYEILVADGESTDATPAIVAELAADYPQLYLLQNPKRWSSAGRNVAIRAARGDLIVLVDGHCELANPNYLSDLADAFARSGADCVGRPQPLDVRAATPLQRAIAAARSSWLGHNPDSFIYSSVEQFVRPQSVAVAYRREVFETIGLFDENFDACEDVEFNHRLEHAGFRCFFSPRVRIRYYPRNRLRGLFQQLVRYGRGRVRLLKKHSDTFTIACFVPAAFVLGLVIGPLLALLSTGLALTYAGVLSVYAMTVALVSLALAAKARDARQLAWLPLAFLMIHTGAGTGILREWIAGWWHKGTPGQTGEIVLPPRRSQQAREERVAA